MRRSVHRQALSQQRDFEIVRMLSDYSVCVTLVFFIDLHQPPDIETHPKTQNTGSWYYRVIE